MRIEGKSIDIGYFPTPEEAHDAYCRVSREVHGEFSGTI